MTADKVVSIAKVLCLIAQESQQRLLMMLHIRQDAQITPQFDLSARSSRPPVRPRLESPVVRCERVRFTHKKMEEQRVKTSFFFFLPQVKKKVQLTS